MQMVLPSMSSRPLIVREYLSPATGRNSNARAHVLSTLSGHSGKCFWQVHACLAVDEMIGVMLLSKNWYILISIGYVAVMLR